MAVEFLRKHQKAGSCHLAHGALAEKPQIGPESFTHWMVDDHCETDEFSTMSATEEDDDEEARARNVEFVRDKIKGSLHMAAVPGNRNESVTMAELLWEGRAKKVDETDKSNVREAMSTRGFGADNAIPGLYNDLGSMFDKDNTASPERVMYLDVEAVPGYEGSYPGTISVPGLWLECEVLVHESKHEDSLEVRPSLQAETSGDWGKGAVFCHGEPNASPGPEFERTRATSELSEAKSSIMHEDLELQRGNEQDAINRPTIDRSSVHWRQAGDDLVHFAKRIGWPFVSQLERRVHKTCIKAQDGSRVVLSDVRNQFDGMAPPGRGTASKMMWALVLCSPPTAGWAEAPDLVEHGLNFRDRSIWRTSTMLGRVLGGYPGVTSTCGWVGPCPPVEIDPPLSKHEKHGPPPTIQLLAQRTSLIGAVFHEGTFKSGLASGVFRHKEFQPREGESTATFGADIRNASRWSVLRPPAPDPKVISIKKIRLRRPDPSVAILFDEPFGHPQLRWKTTITFTCTSRSGLFKHHRMMAFSLHYNPIFVTPPHCRDGKGPDGEHEVHAREMAVYGFLVLPIDQLKDHDGDVGKGKVIVINATAQGAEVMARAWCAEKGKNAVVRRAGSKLCFSCAIRMASGHDGSGLGVLIWA